MCCALPSVLRVSFRRDGFKCTEAALVLSCTMVESSGSFGMMRLQSLLESGRSNPPHPLKTPLASSLEKMEDRDRNGGCRTPLPWNPRSSKSCSSLFHTDARPTPPVQSFFSKLFKKTESSDANGGSAASVPDRRVLLLMFCIPRSPGRETE